MKVRVIAKYMGKWRRFKGKIKREQGMNILYIFRFLGRKVCDIKLPNDLESVIVGNRPMIIVDLDNNKVASLKDMPDFPNEEQIKFYGRLKARIYAAMYEEQIWGRAKRIMLYMVIGFLIAIGMLLIYNYMQQQALLDFFKKFLPGVPAG